MVPGEQGAAKAVHFHLDELPHVVELVLVLDPATLRPVHVGHRHEVEVAQLEDGGDYLEIESWSSALPTNSRKTFKEAKRPTAHLKNITSLVGCHTQVVQGFLKKKKMVKLLF